jgi:hypothetical protein
MKTTTGLITGTPKVAGTSSFTIQATDSGGSAPVSQALSITINPKVKLAVTTTSLKAASENKTYSETLASTGGTLPVSWSLTGGALPTGLTLGASGSITGDPTESGTFDFTVEATDSSSTVETATGSLALTVKPAR